MNGLLAILLILNGLTEKPNEVNLCNWNEKVYTSFQTVESSLTNYLGWTFSNKDTDDTKEALTEIKNIILDNLTVSYKFNELIYSLDTTDDNKEVVEYLLLFNNHLINYYILSLEYITSGNEKIAQDSFIEFDKALHYYNQVSFTINSLNNYCLSKSAFKKYQDIESDNMET